NTFDHFKDATSVSGQQFLKFTVDSTNDAIAWMGDLNRLMAEGVDQGIIAQIAKIGPASEPSVKALQQVVDDGMLKMVNQQQQRLQDMENQTDSAFASMTVAASAQLARQALLQAAQQDQMAGHGIAKLEELRNSSDTQMASMAQNALTQLGIVQ